VPQNSAAVYWHLFLPLMLELCLFFFPTSFDSGICFK
jgi:hypothetical protein